MNIDHINQRLTNIKGSGSTTSLRNGQIVRGEVLKLYPGNKAMIQVGSKTLVAQLGVSLTLGDRYHFQVQMTDEAIYLKVLGDKLKQQSVKSSSNLLKQLGLKTTKDNIALIQSLISDTIPFNIEQLKRAFNILEKESNKDQARNTLKNMLTADLPITKSIFDALNTQGKSDFTEQLKLLQNLLNQQSNHTALELRAGSRIEQIVGPLLTIDEMIEKELLSSVSKKQESLFNALKLTGLIKPETEYAIWKADLEASLGGNTSFTANMANHMTNGVYPSQKLDRTSIVATLKQLKDNQQVLVENSGKWLSLFSTKVTQAVVSKSPLSPVVFSQASHYISEKVIPYLPEEQQNELRKLLQNNPESLEKLMKMMQPMNDSRVYRAVSHVLEHDQLSAEFISRPVEERLSHYIRQFSTLIGLSYENELVEGTSTQLQNTLKGLLLQLMHQGEGAVKEQASQILNVINGLQLQSVNEVNNIFYAHLQVPGEKLGLKNEIELKFEGKKKDGRVDSDYCRIHFYLNLDYLKETIIDMNVQNRSVTVTIYNDSNELKKIAAPFSTPLKKGLESLDYHLSAVLFKSIDSGSTDKSVEKSKVYDTYTKGMDYRV